MADVNLKYVAIVLLAFGLVNTVRCDEDQADTCDFIIIGAGTTGLTLASTLAEIPHWKICVLERGPLEKRMNGWYTNDYKFTSPHDPFWLTKPVLQTMVTNSNGYISNANKDGRLIYIPRYRGRGGTSRVYGAIGRRASPAVLDMWPRGWKHDDLTPYYKRTEDHYCYYDLNNSTGISEEECKKWHGKGGKMQLNTQLEEAFHKFPREMKYLCEDKSMPWKGFAHDYNGPIEDRISCSIFQQFKLRTNKTHHPTKEARHNRTSQTARGSSYTGYYQHNDGNKPLLFHGAPVTKILFEGTKAVGVTYLDEYGQTNTLRARTEVIVSGGSFDTPHLLQVSGVGPKKLLKDIKVEVVAENEHVGQHLWDHISVPYVLKLSKESDNLCCPSVGSDTPTVNIDGKQYETKTLSSINGPFSWILHMRSNVSREPEEMSDIQIYVMGDSKLFDETGALCTAEQPEYDDPFDEHYEDKSEENEGTIRIIDQWPEYRGYINAVTSNIFDKPILEYGWNFTTDGETTMEFKKVSKLFRDQVRMLRNMFFGKDVHKGLRDLILDEVQPGRNKTTDEELNNWMRGMLVSALHPVGTCKMPECADEFLQVRGVSNLRVCDASAFATQIDGNPAATLYAMGEKLADMIKFQYLKDVRVAIRLEIPNQVDNKSPFTPDESITKKMKLSTQCIDASISVDMLPTGKDTSALVIKWSLLCGEDSNERDIADNVVKTTLDLVSVEGCSSRDYPLFNRDEATLPRKEPTPKQESSSYIFIVWCQFFEDVNPNELWTKAGKWNSEEGKVVGSESCFKLNCDPKACSILNYANDANRELIYNEPGMVLRLPLTDYISTKKVVARNQMKTHVVENSKSSAFMRTGSMISNPGVDWDKEIASYLLERVYASSGRRFSREYPPLNKQGGWWTEDSDGRLYYEMKGIRSSNLVAAFDLDGTIIRTKSGGTFPEDEHDWEFTSEQVKINLQDNYENKINNVIMSNQNGIGNGLQDKVEWMAKIEEVTSELGVPMYVIAATEDNQYRKPKTGMWDYYNCTLNQFKTIVKTKAIYVGDAAGRPEDYSDSDKVFAKNIGIKFNTPEEYFAAPDKYERQEL